MTENADAQSGALENPEDAGLGPAGVVKRWLMELELADKTEEYWRTQAKDTAARYRDEKDTVRDPGRYSKSNRFNILYSNVQTICPALYNQTPKPDVRRRYRDQDPSGKYISEVIERSLSYTMDAYDLDRIMKLTVKDSQIVGRGVDRVKYKPTFAEEKDEKGEAFEALKYEEVCWEHVNWSDFRRGPGRIWEEVTWVAFRHLLNREEAKEKFGDNADEVELDYTPLGMDNDEADPVNDTFKRMIVWEIWDKEGKEVLFIAPSLKERPLKTEDDPLGLAGFFPIPRPLYATETSDSLVPIEPFRFYHDQANELDEITKRISGIIKACKARGVYDSTISEMANLMDAGEGILVSSENIINLISQGGIEKAIWIWPIDKIAAVLVHLYTQREAIKTTIYEITGIADIMRGSSAAQETLGAQQLKAQFGTMRLDDMRREVQRYARDLVRLAAEVIAEHFRPETLMTMTGLQVTPEMLEIMRLDGPRGFRIDIETDSTVAGDVATEQKNMTELLTGVAQFMQMAGPAVQMGYIPMEAAKAMLLSAVRRFKMGREVEDALDQIGQQQPGQQGGQSDPAAQAEAMKAQAEMQSMQQQAQVEQAKAQAEMQVNQSRAQADMQIAMMKAQADIEIMRQKAAAEIQLAREEMAVRMELEREKAHLNANVKREGQFLSNTSGLPPAGVS